MLDCTLNKTSVLSYYAVYLGRSAAMPSAIFVCNHCAYDFISQHSSGHHRIELLNADFFTDAVKHCTDIIEINDTNNASTRRALDKVEFDE
jgi:hypothetical protein